MGNQTDSSRLGTILFIAAAISIFSGSLSSIKIALPSVWIIARFSIVPQLLQITLLKSTFRDMESQASSLLALMQSKSVALPIIQNGLRQLKADIKHKNVPQSAVAPTFDIIRCALRSNEHLDLGFSTLTHLTKRLIQQGQVPLLELQTRRTTPLLFELFHHEKERLRVRAVQALAELSTISVGVYNNVETILRDDGFRTGSPRVIGAMHQDNVLNSLRALSFIAPLVECLKHAESSINTAAKNTLIELFRDMDDRDKDTLKSRMRQRRVSETLMNEIMPQISRTTPNDESVTRPVVPEPQIIRTRPVSRPGPSFESKPQHPHLAEPSAQAPSHSQPTPSVEAPVVPPTSATTNLPTKPAEASVQPLSFSPELSTAELEASKIEPFYVESAKDLENLFADMLPHFAGKETEQNWTRREQSALKIRRVTRGNAPEQYIVQYTAGIKSLTDGLVKGCSSLRTSLSTITCHCVQDIARTLKQGLDPMVEVLLQCLLKLCAATKKLTSASGNACVTEIVSVVAFTTRVSQHLLNATTDKNVQPRLYATKWIMIVLTRHGRQRSHIESHLGNLTTAITNGLNDRDKDVREAMRPTFWAFARLWSDKSKNLLSKLDKKQQDLLLGDASNPFPGDWFAAPSSTTNAPTKSTSSKPSIKEAIAQQRLQKKGPSERPGSAAEIATPARDISAQVPARPKSSLLTTRRPMLASSTGSMSSAPVRPNRPVRKADVKTETKTETAPNTRPHETPAARPHRFFEARTPAKPSAKAAPTPKAESVPTAQTPTAIPAEPPAPAADGHKRVSWSEEDMPVEFHSHRPSNEVASASIRKPPTDPVETFTRNPDNGKATDLVGEASTSQTNDANNRSDKQMLRYPSDATPASLPVEPSGLLDSEATHLSVDARFDISAPELAAYNTPRMPRRSSLKSSNRLDLSKQQPAESDATSHTTHTTSENTAQTSVDDESTTLEFGTATRLSQSPRPLASRKEANKKDDDSGRLRVYEDDDKMSEDPWLQIALESAPPNTSAKAVLGELPINTEIPKRRNSFSSKTSTEQNINVHGVRQTIGRAIPRIKEGTLDQGNFKDLRHLIYRDSIWATADEGQTMLDELVLSLAGVLHGNTAYTDMDHGQLLQLRVEAIQTLVALNIKNKMDFAKWSFRIIRSMVLARNDCPGNQHIVFIMQNFAKTLIERAEQERSLDNILKILEAEGLGSIELEGQSTLMALDLLTLLVARGNEGISEDTESRLGRVACQAMVDFGTDMRMAGTALATKMFAVVKPESRYWRLMIQLSDEHKNLLTYYVSRV